LLPNGVEISVVIASIKGGPVKRKNLPSPLNGFSISGIFQMPPSLVSDPTRSFTDGTEERIRTEHPSGLFKFNVSG